MLSQVNCRTCELVSIMGRPTRYTDEELARAVAASVSVAQVLRTLGVKQAGGSHFHISKRIVSLGLDTSHFLGKAAGRGRRQRRLTPDEILVRRDPDAPRAKPALLRRALSETGVPYECAGCGASGTWMGRPLILHVDHRDGDSANNERENLQFLCPNCHSQTATYCRQLSARGKP